MLGTEHCAAAESARRVEANQLRSLLAAFDVVDDALKAMGAELKLRWTPAAEKPEADHA